MKSLLIDSLKDLYLLFILVPVTASGEVKYLIIIEFYNKIIYNYFLFVTKKVTISTMVGDKYKTVVRFDEFYL